MSRRCVLVTGAGGFIGSHVVRDQLDRGHRVRALDIDGSRLEELRASNSNVAGPDKTTVGRFR